MKHTKGPWKIDKNYILDKEDYLIATIAKVTDRESDSLEETKETKLITAGNANLISAAPELLDALEKMYEVYKVLANKNETIDDSRMMEARNAIAKAKGEIK